MGTQKISEMVLDFAGDFLRLAGPRSTPRTPLRNARPQSPAKIPADNVYQCITIGLCGAPGGATVKGCPGPGPHKHWPPAIAGAARRKDQ